MTRPGYFTPEKVSVPLVQEAGSAAVLVRTGAENLAPPQFDTRTVQAVATRYTHYAISVQGRGVCYCIMLHLW
jgi:hypothetical protein